jgi:hypothetical protein
MNRFACLAAVAAMVIPAVVQATPIELNFSPQPSRVVENRITTSMTQRVDLKGDEDLIARHFSQGTTFPSTIRTESRLVTRQSSEAKNRDGSFNFEIQYLDSESKSLNAIGLPMPVGDPAANLVGTRVNGRVDSAGRAHYVSHVSSRVNSLSPSEVAAVLQGTFSAMAKLDRIKLNVGEIATQDFRLDIPLPGLSPVTLLMESTYRLVEVAGDDARFSVQTRFALGEFPKGAHVALTGSGYGAMIYNTSLMSMTSSSTIMRLKLKVRLNQLAQTLESNSRVITETTVTLQ